MKKILVLLCFFITGVIAYAEDGYGKCSINSSDYIEVSVNISDGIMRVANSSSRPVVSVFINVEATEYCAYDENGQGFGKTYKATLFSDRVWSLASYEVKEVKLNVPNTHPYHVRWDAVVKVNNPICN